MKKWRDTFTMFIKRKSYIVLLALAALAGYGFKVMHPAIGIDDTPYAYYFEEGLVAIVGRWVLFLVNKILSIGEYAPFFTDFAAVLIFMLAVTVWSALFYSVFGEHIPKWGYAFFAVLFLTNPLISEVFTYFLHNGIAVGYLFSGISLCALREARLRLGLAKGFGGAELPVKRSVRDRVKASALPLLCTAVCMCISIGCYESFMIVWLSGVALTLLSERMEGLKGKVWSSLFLSAGLAVTGLLLRSLMIALVTKGFGLENLQDEAVQRSVTELAGWMLEPGAFSEFAMVLKRIFVMYGVFAYAYYPIKIFVLASVILFLVSVWKGVCRRDVWIPVLMLGGFLVSFLLVIVEGKATLYRSAQFLPLISAFGLLLPVYAGRGIGEALTGRQNAKTALMNGKHTAWKGVFGKTVKGLAVIGLSVICFNQCSDLNSWFYIDYLKYESAKETMYQVAYELEKGYDTSKPVIFTGIYEIPASLIQKAYVPYGSETWYKMKRLTDPVDEHLLEKFNRPDGVWVAQTPSLSVIEWGRFAFDDDTELVRFFSMHGRGLIPLTDREAYPEAEEYSRDFPDFPQEGSIVDCGDYIIVHF